MKPGEAFDFAVFDEAHKTAGREGRNFAFALDDKNLCIRKRLFVTATPRHYNPLTKSKEGGAQLVFSMDKREIYGPIVYRLPFSVAAKRGIITDYKIIISEVTSEMVNDELLRRGIVLVEGENFFSPGRFRSAIRGAPSQASDSGTPPRSARDEVTRWRIQGR